MQIVFEEKESKLLKAIGEIAAQQNLPTYVVGGWVRDKLLGRNSKDIDILCVGDALTLATALSEKWHGINKVNIFKTFGTAQLTYQDMDIEFVGARKESYNSDSRKPLVSAGTLQDDILRRDLTINAIAISIMPNDFGTMIDLCNGYKDLQEQYLQTPLDPDITFSDDPLRMLRTIRFASQLQFSILNNTYQAIERNAERIKIISKERIADELNKILMSPKPSIGLELLFKSKLLAIIFPHLADLAGAEFLDGIGHKDNFYHTIQVVDNIAMHTHNVWLRWAALLHDIGKPATKLFEKGHGWTFHNHEWIGAQMIPGIFKFLKLPQNEHMKYVQKLVSLHHRPVSLTKENISDSAIRRLLFDAGNELEDLLVLCNADMTSKNAEKIAKYKANYEVVKERLAAVEAMDHIRNWQPPISGDFIMNTFQLRPCREVGLIKDAVKEAILEGKIKNDFDEAYQFMITYAKSIGVVK